MPTSGFAAGLYAQTQGLGAGTLKKASVASAGGGAGPDFSKMLGDALDQTAKAGAKADQQAAAVATGRADIVDVVTAVAESEAAIETLVAVRDRMIAAYEEIMRMPI